MESGLGFDELMIDPFQHRVFAEGEWIVEGFFDRVVRISASGIHVGDRMANGARNSSLRGWVFDIIEMGIIERTAKERHGIMATSTPTSCFDASVAFQRYFAGLSDADEIRRIVE